MAKGLVNESSLNSIAEAINVLNGTEGTYMPSEMGEAIIDAIPTKTASGNPIHITDAAAYPVKECVTTLEPVQDLHGYDKPWPAGGGKNLLPMTVDGIKAVNTIGTWSGNVYTIGEVTFTIQTDSDDNVTGILANGTASGNVIFISSATYVLSGSYILSGCPQNGDPQTYRVDLRRSSNDTVIGYDVGESLSINQMTENCYITIRVQNGTVVNNLVFKPMIRLATVADATFEPYSNICPITGHTGVELTRTGKNLLDDEFESGKIDWTTGQNASDASCIRSKNYSPIKGGLTYYFSIKNGSTDGGEANIFWYDADKNFISATYATNVYPSTLTIIAPDNAAYVRVSPHASYGTTYNNDVGMIYPATATSYEPYQGEPHSITFPQAQSPVYGGEVDWVNGVLRVTEANIASYNGETLPSTWISDRDVYAEGTTPSIGAQVVYELATPLEIPLTSEIITLLKGENNIWTDSGTSEIEYKVDLQTYIQKLINEASTTASLTSVNPLSLVKSVEEVDEEKPESEDETGETKKITDDEPADVKELDEAEKTKEPESETEDEAEEKPTELLVEEDTEAEPTVKEPDTLEKEDGDTV